MLKIQKFQTAADLEEAVDNGRFYVHHTAMVRKYVSRSSSGVVSPYKGRFGEGYTLDTSNPRSSQFSYRTYYIMAN